MSFFDKMKQIASETDSKLQTAQDERRQRRLNLIDAQLAHFNEVVATDVANLNRLIQTTGATPIVV